jgi:hypothetical protein
MMVKKLARRNQLSDIFKRYDLTGGLNDGKIHTELCWPWKVKEYALNGKGIAVFSYSGKSYYGHRVVYHVVHPKDFPLDDPRLIRHTVCDNNLCGNYHHMMPGTHQDNMNDAVESGRFGLTQDMISAIIHLLTETDLTHQRIADRVSFQFERKISRQAVTDINTDYRNKRRKEHKDGESS